MLFRSSGVPFHGVQDLRQWIVRFFHLQQRREDDMNVIRHDAVRQQIVAFPGEVVHTVGHQFRDLWISEPVRPAALIQHSVPLAKETPLLQIQPFRALWRIGQPFQLSQNPLGFRVEGGQHGRGNGSHQPKRYEERRAGRLNVW